MKSLQNRLLAAFCYTVTLLFLGVSIAHGQDDTLQPNPDLGPADVVAIQMAALQNNDEPFKNAGIEITFRFASPNNKRSTGPLERFSALFDNPAYGPMLNHRALELGEADIIGSRALVPVFMEAEDGSRVTYVFLLSKQAAGEWAECWMTDSVTPVEIKRSESVTL